MTRITMKKTAIIAISAASLTAAGCQSMTPAQRNAAIGTGVGAAAGAAVAGDETTGALVGGALGAAAGYYTGCRQQGGCYIGGDQVASYDERRYDQSAGRYYYEDPNSGTTYWSNGDVRTQGRVR